MAGGAWGPRARRHLTTLTTGIGTTHRPPPSLLSGVASCRLHKDAAMTASPYPHLFATLGDAATRLPDDLARTLEDTFVALQSGNNAGTITLQACLQHIR